MSVCHMHGAGSRKRVREGKRKDPAKVNLRHGVYSRYAPPGQEEALLDLARAPDLTKLNHEIARLRLWVAQVEGREETKDYTTQDKLNDFLKIVHALMNAVEKHSRVTEGLKVTISGEKVREFAEKLLDRMEEAMKELPEEQRERIIGEVIMGLEDGDPEESRNSASANGLPEEV